MNNDQNRNQGGSQGNNPNREQQNQGDRKPGQPDREQQDQQGNKPGQQGGGDFNRDRQPGGNPK